MIRWEVEIALAALEQRVKGKCQKLELRTTFTDSSIVETSNGERWTGLILDNRIKLHVDIIVQTYNIDISI